MLAINYNKILRVINNTISDITLINNPIAPGTLFLSILKLRIPSITPAGAKIMPSVNQENKPNIIEREPNTAARFISSCNSF